MSDRDDATKPVNVYWGLPVSNPRAVEGGIVARSQAGAFAHHWWSRRWLKALTQWASTARLSRGRAYARRGQIIELHLEPGLVSAQVQGTRPEPYEVRLHLRVFNDAEWQRILGEMASQALFAAQLLNGEMPQGIEKIFDAAGVHLFPTTHDDLEVSCSCPDWVEFCKHVAAVCYLIGERLDEDPFLLLAMRGRSKDDIMEALCANRSVPPPGATPADSPAPEATEHEMGSVPLDRALDSFWRMGPEIEQLRIRVEPPEIEAQLLKLLGEPSFADPQIGQQLVEIYQRVSRRALEIAFGEPEEVAEQGNVK